MKKLSSIMFDDIPTEDSENAVTSGGVFKAIQSGGGGGGTSDYNYLSNKPKINGVELSGNKTLASLGIASDDNLTSVSDRVTQAESDIDSLETSVSEKATTASVTALGDRVTQAESDIDSLETSVSEKATTASVTALGDRVTQAESDIDSLETSVSEKATTASVTALADRITQAESDIDSLENDFDDVQSMIDTSIESIIPTSKTAFSTVIADKVLDSNSYTFTSSSKGLLIVKGYKTTTGNTCTLSINGVDVDNIPMYSPYSGGFILLGFVKIGDIVTVSVDNESNFSDWVLTKIHVINISF